VWTEEKRKLNEAKDKTRDYQIGQLIFQRATELTSAQKNRSAQKYRIVEALRRRDENGDIYDVTRIFIDEAIRHPFAAHDDLLDAVARIYDMDPQIPVHYEVQSTESSAVCAHAVGLGHSSAIRRATAPIVSKLNRRPAWNA
jgi:hypothetical protein